MRISAYVQSFLCVLTAICYAAPNSDSTNSLGVDDEALSGVMESGVSALFTVTALLISAFIDGAAYHRLTMFQATITCYLCWMLLCTASVPYVIAVTRWKQGSFQFHQLLTKLYVMLGLFTIAFIILGAFGIWIYSLRLSYDRTLPDDCATSTVSYFFGRYYIIGVSGPYQVLWLIVYSVALIPFINILALLAFTSVVPSFLCFFLLLIKPYGDKLVFAPRRELVAEYRIPASIKYGTVASVLVLLALLCVTIEKTVGANHLQTSVRAWGTGQIYPVLVAAIPLFQLLGIFWEGFHVLVPFHNMFGRTHPDRTPGAAAGPAAVHSPDGKNQADTPPLGGGGASGDVESGLGAGEVRNRGPSRAVPHSE
jgi:hypothetical protein